MNLIKVAVGVLNQTPLAWRSNLAHIRAAIAMARDAEASLLCLPEMCITGYGCEDAHHSRGVHRRAWDALVDLAPRTRGMVVTVGLPVFHQNAVFNCACLLCDGRIMGFVPKRYLAGDGIHYEPRWFKPWPEGVIDHLHTPEGHPIGDIYFDCGGVQIGFEVCEDAWVATRPGAKLSLKGVDLILNPSASHFAFGKLKIRERFVLEGSRAFGVSYLYSNLVGNEAGRAIYDGGALIATAGTLVASGPRFSYRDVDITTATLDVDHTRTLQARTWSRRPALSGDDPSRVTVAFPWPAREPEPYDPQPAAWEAGPYLKEESFSRAVALSLHDYLRKSHSTGFVVSLSGGADSAAVATLVYLMVRFAAAEIGLPALAERVRGLAGESPPADARETVGRLLTCVYQSTANSGETTRRAAEEVAGALGAEYHHFAVQSLVDGYRALGEQALGRPLSWERDDISLQNIQARARGPGVWLLANLRGALLLATSNRSEAAVGYATMDGDTCGGLSPIAGIDKAFLRQWLRWMETAGPDGVGPLPALELVNVQQPTAELRPPGAEQTDEGDLMPYPLLDEMERAAIRDKKTPGEVFTLLCARHPEVPRAQLRAWAVRFFRLFARNQWKRERYAPSFHLDDENLDPKTWCRWPILSGGFEAELEELPGDPDGG